jgi:hypothetical protein
MVLTTISSHDNIASSIWPRHFFERLPTNNGQGDLLLRATIFSEFAAAVASFDPRCLTRAHLFVWR